MSINITVHGNPLNFGKQKSYLVDNERAKKDEYEKRKKQRLEQVRQKSKEIATQLRRNVEREKRKQLEQIDKIKKDELLRWREKSSAQIKNQYDNILEKDIGIAHKTAQEQPEILVPCEGKKRWLRPEKKLPTKYTGKFNLVGQKNVTTTKTMTTKKHTKITPTKILCTANREKLNDENSSNIANIETSKTQKDGSKNHFHATKITKTKFSPKAQMKDDEISNASISSVGSSPKVKKKAKLIQTPSVVMEIDSDSDSSSMSLSIEDTHNLSNMQYSRIKTKQPSLNPPEICKKRKHQIESKNTKRDDDSKKIISSVLSKPTQQTRFTQISDLIRQKSQEEEPMRQGRTHRCQSPIKTNLRKQFEGGGYVTRSTSMSPKRCTRCSPSRSSVKIIRSTPSSPRKSDMIGKTVSINTPKKSIRSTISMKSNTKLSDLSSKQQQQTQKNRVQFYDYNNKFEKRYEHPSNFVYSEKIPCGLNAMERAEIEAELQECKQKELEKLKKISDERCQRALERELVRKDYEALTAKLDAINKDRNAQKEFKGNEHLFSNVRLKNVEEQQQQKLNTEIINILKRPTIVTCPDIKNSKINVNTKQNSSDFNLAEKEKQNFNNVRTVVNSSSDSCSSILLQYVNDETKKISNNIANCDNAQKIHKFQLLLNKINDLRNKLMNEIKNLNKNVPLSKENFQEIFDSLESVEKEREEILNKEDKKKQDEKFGNTTQLNEENMKEKYKKKEKELKRREAILEKKLKDLYKTTLKLPDEKKKKNVPEMLNENKDQSETASTTITATTTPTIIDENESEILASEKILAQKPIEIVIKVQNQKNTKSFKSPRKRLKNPNLRKMKKYCNTENSISIERSSAKNLIVKSPIKSSKLKSPDRNPIKDGKQPESKNIQYDEQHETCTVTSYRSLPNKVKTLLTHTLNDKKIEMKDVGKQKMKNIEVETIEPLFKKSALIPNKKNQIHPQLMHYVQRLLGMSHHAIEMLGVSTSEIETPSSSIVNNSQNISTTESESFEKNKIERLKKFIQDNYTFLNEIDESLKRDTSVMSNDFNDIKTIEEIWKQTLHRKKQQEIIDTKKNKTKSILKKMKTPTPKKKSISSTDIIDQEPFSAPTSELPKKISVTTNDTLKLTQTEMKPASGAKKELIGKYNELTEHCAQRIAELNEMIIKVREEKQKILEITLSSGGETARTSTEYADFCEQNNVVDKSGSNKISDKQKIPSTNVSQSPEKILLEKNKITGVSRDSGISLSRPVTALGSHESPDMPSSIQEDFEPILKDIPKPSKITPTVQIIPPPSITETITTNGGKLKKEKPPVTLDRYSPQFGEELQPPHELSTIVEVDTPATSRLNTSVTDKQSEEKPALENDPSLNIEKLKESITYQKFPSFNEYVKLNKLDLSKFDDSTISRAQSEYEEIITKIETQQNNIENNNNGQQTSNLIQEVKNLIESLKLFNLSFKKFPSRKEYMDKMGITDSFDSKSVEIMEFAEITNKDQHKTDSSIKKENSTESLLDVVEELKRRNMLQESFQYDVPEKDKLSENDILETTISSSSNNKENKSNAISMKKKLHSVKNRSSTGVIDSTLSGVEAIPPTISATSQSPNQSHSDDIEKDLQRMGLTWAATMIRKSQLNRKELASTSSSITNDVSPSKRESMVRSKVDKISKSIKKEFSDITNESIDDTVSRGQRLNLREFLAKELQKRTITSSASNSILLSSSEGSVTSQFLRSLLGSSSSRSSDKRSDRVKTSTPINYVRSASKSSSSLSSHNKNSHTGSDNHHSQKFFSGDSRPSSVNFSNSEMYDDDKHEKNIRKSDHEKTKQNS